MTKLQEIAKLGQSIWLDYIRRSFIESGDLQALIDKGLRGVTSNPSIFEKAIAGSNDYDQQLRRLANTGKSLEEIYEALVIQDIQRAADLLRPVYVQTGGTDGYVSLEASPKLAHDTYGTTNEVRHLFASVDRPNVMIKVPATPEGIPAIEALIGEGINVNVTLIFSLDQYEAVAQAYIAGLEKLAGTGADIGLVASVASFFVSRVDSAVDQELETVGAAGRHLQGVTAISNAKVSYARFGEIFSGERWEHLAAQGARVQRLLWGSTSTKNPDYPDTLYVDNLIGSDTVNTLPPRTLRAFLDHGRVAPTLKNDLDKAHSHLLRLAELGIDLDTITQKLLDDGVRAFAKSFEGLISSIAEKRENLLAGWERISANLGSHTASVDEAVANMSSSQLVSRIWAHDHTVWEPHPEEITNRLGWLHSPDVMEHQVARMQALLEAVRAGGYTDALLLGMGGSSLAPELFQNTFGVSTDEGYLNLNVLDSTNPGAVLEHAEQLDLARTLFIVSSKSGGTLETLSFFRYFYNQAAEAVGPEEAGSHFIAITDAGTHLANLADRYGFRATFINDPNIGGRYSALSYFGLVPATLVGVDVPRLLDRALTVACACDSCVAAEQNPCVYLGAIMAALSEAGRDKATFITTSPLSSFGDWVEQLIAESTGKEGTGILPLVKEPIGLPDVYADDRFFVYLRLDEQPEEDQDMLVDSYEIAGFPVVRLHLQDLYDLGGQFFLWEMATAVAGHLLGVNPFNQPNVEAAKMRTNETIKACIEMGSLPKEIPALVDGGITVYSGPPGGLGDSVSGNSTKEVLNSFLSQAEPGAYIALQAYLQPTVEVEAALRSLSARLRDETRLATTIGYGPRYLHSTGQLHKGDAGRGLFVQFTADDPKDASIPDEAGSPDSSITFGTLETAQALGDRQALLDSGRRVIRFHLGPDVIEGLNRLGEAI